MIGRPSRVQGPLDRRLTQGETVRWLARGITREYLVTGHRPPPASPIGLDKVTKVTAVTQRLHNPTYRSGPG